MKRAWYVVLQSHTDTSFIHSYSFVMNYEVTYSSQHSSFFYFNPTPYTIWRYHRENISSIFIRSEFFWGVVACMCCQYERCHNNGPFVTDLKNISYTLIYLGVSKSQFCTATCRDRVKFLCKTFVFPNTIKRIFKYIHPTDSAPIHSNVIAKRNDLIF